MGGGGHFGGSLLAGGELAEEWAEMLFSDLNKRTLEVLDLEATGLYPGGTDRIIEVAILRVANGQTRVGYQGLRD